MVSLGAVGSAVAVGAATGVVLRDVIGHDRPRAPRPSRVPAPPTFEQLALEVEDRSETWPLATLAPTESDDHNVVRRVGALVVLLAVTLTASALLGAAIYRGVTTLK